MKPIKNGYEYLLSENSVVDENEQSFRIYKDERDIGRYLFDDLYKKMVYNDELKAYIYYLNDNNMNVGLLPQLYGCLGLLNMINRFQIEITKEEKERIDALLCNILDYIENGNKGHRYDFSPYLAPKVNEKIFSKYNYVGTVSWALSLFVIIRHLNNLKILTFNESILNRVNEKIKYLVKNLIDSVVGGSENPIGWGYSTQKDVSQSLYYTFLVLETYSDIDDNIMDSVGNKKDNELIEFIGKDPDDNEYYIDKFVKICTKIGDNTWNIYKNDLKNSFVDDAYKKDHQIIKNETLFNVRRSNALFNTLFIIDIMFCTYENIRNKEESEDIVSLYTVAFQNLLNVYHDLKKANRETSVEKYILYFDGEDENIKLLNENVIQMETLMPLVISTLNKIALYIYKFPQQDMTDLFDIMLDKKSDDAWLWEKNRYDLLVTQRYEGAFIAYFEYYDKYERNYAKKSKNDQELRADIKKELKTEVEKEIEKEYERKFAEKLDEAAKQLGNEFVIENEINKRIDEKIEKEGVKIVNKLLNKAIEYNNASAQQKRNFDFTNSQREFYENLNKYFISLVHADIKDVADGNEEKMLEIEKVAIDEAKEFTKKYIELSNSNLVRNNKVKLSNLLDLLESYLTAINKYNNSHKNDTINPLTGFDKMI